MSMCRHVYVSTGTLSGQRVHFFESNSPELELQTVVWYLLCAENCI